MDKQKQVEEMAKRLPTIEEIEKEYKEWAVGLLKVRFDLKPEAFDEHHKNNYSFENCADCLWNKIKGSIEELLWLRKNQLPENVVVLPKKLYELYMNEFNNYEVGKRNGSKETAEKFAERLKELEEALLDMVVQFCQMGEYGKLKHAFMSAEEQAFDILNIKYGEKVDKVYKRFNKKWSKPIDEICKEITEGKNG